ncbi:hypothetical protein J5N97_024413 [Dioscorea zingiberensis]|uniref:Pre-mRNA-processing factor 39 n=1 Tax=Dioscorea zingiberensis TaxID=325984 RepID=A0A9D5C6C2_9LILI|nr:hypothetical protein J5N97_024413 [Dioscorea zingiberensis]
MGRFIRSPGLRRPSALARLYRLVVHGVKVRVNAGDSIGPSFSIFRAVSADWHSTSPFPGCFSFGCGVCSCAFLASWFSCGIPVLVRRALPHARSLCPTPPHRRQVTSRRHSMALCPGRRHCRQTVMVLVGMWMVGGDLRWEVGFSLCSWRGSPCNRGRFLLVTFSQPPFLEFFSCGRVGGGGGGVGSASPPRIAPAQVSWRRLCRVFRSSLRLACGSSLVLSELLVLVRSEPGEGFRFQAWRLDSGFSLPLFVIRLVLSPVISAASFLSSLVAGPLLYFIQRQRGMMGNYNGFTTTIKSCLQIMLLLFVQVCGVAAACSGAGPGACRGVVQCGRLLGGSVWQYGALVVQAAALVRLSSLGAYSKAGSLATKFAYRRCCSGWRSSESVTSSAWRSRNPNPPPVVHSLTPISRAGNLSSEYTMDNSVSVPDSADTTGDINQSASSAAAVYVSGDSSNAVDGNVPITCLSAAVQESTQVVLPESKPDDLAPNVSENSVHENAVEMSVHAVGYDTVNGSSSEMVGYQSTVVTENGSVANEIGGPVPQEHFEDVYNPEEERLWNLVRANCLDFNSWTTLIEETEKVAENNIGKIQKVYDAFLAEFPLCFGYWKKYADHEGRLDSVDKVIEVYERAVLAVTYSVDIWLHYCVFAMSTYEDPDVIRRLFERGLAYVGTDYLSYPLWDEYIRYEESRQAWSSLALIYTRILEHPIQQLDRYYNCFKDLAAGHPLSEILTSEEATMLAAPIEADTKGGEGEVHPDGVDQSSKLVSAGSTEAEELEKYIAIRDEMYKKAKEFDSKIVDFETAIRRPYFHVRPLDDPELDNWHNYLDFIERGDDFNKVVKLYERCLIACASYSEYWIRYVLCMEASGSMELANNALARATQVFVKRQPEIHLFAARFREFSGDIPGARAEYQVVYSEISPCYLEAIVKHANMEYRLGFKEAAAAVYEEVIAAEQAKEHSQILPMLLVQYSRFLFLVSGNTEKAREVLAGAQENVQLSKPFLEAVIHLESIQSSPKRFDYLDSLVEKYIVPNPESPSLAITSDREELSSVYLEFLDLFGDAQSIKKAENRHSMLFLRQKALSVSKKRHAEDFLSSDRAKMAKTYTNAPSPGQSGVGAYPNAQSQWPAGYGQKAQSWPQTPQAQGQQWNPGYAPQAGYSAYGGYANYSHPQMPASAPQGAAYGAYPSTYPAQAYPQQNYAQPAAAAFPQPPAAVPQQYYGTYY